MAESDLEATITEEDMPEDSEQGTSSLVYEEVASGTDQLNESDRSVRIKYEVFFELPPKGSKKFLAKCRLCHHGKPYKYTASSKGNLLKHLRGSHSKKLDDHKKELLKQLSDTNQHTLHKDGTLVRCAATRSKPSEAFKKQDMMILTCIVKNVCGRGGLPISVVEQSWFRAFMEEIEPRFQPVSRISVSTKLTKLYEEEKSRLLADIATSVVKKPSVTVDFWTGCDVRSFMGCTVHYISQNQLKSHMLFFVEVRPPHTSEVIKSRFEDELDNLDISCFRVVTDNASNMKHAFEEENEDEDDDEENDGESVEMDPLQQWTVKSFKFEGWIGCAAHQIQLVVNDGYNELKSYRRVQAIFAKVKAISALSRRSSHFAYSLEMKIPAPNDTCWNSHYKLHAHVLKHYGSINKSLQEVNKSELIISSTQIEVLSLIVEVMQYFCEATDILQGEGFPTFNQVIPVIDSLENALMQAKRDNAAVNALCERLLTSLRDRFQYLLSSDIHKVATALDPRKKLSFTDHQKPDKVFVFTSSVVILSIKSLLPSDSQPVQASTSTPSVNVEPTVKKAGYCSTSTSDDPASVNDVNTELQIYLDQPRLDVLPIEFWTQRKVTPLSTLALQLLTIPCSSAPVERLFSKAGIILNQRRTRTGSKKLEQLIFLK